VRYLKRLGVALVVVVVLLLVVAMLLPAQVTVQRSIAVQAPRCNVFALLDGYSWFDDFSPWAGRDPDTRYTFEGPSRGVGARMSWQSSSPEVGSGSMQTTLSEPCERIEQDLDFGAQGSAVAWWDLRPVEDGVQVTWGLDSDFGMNPVGRFMGLMMDGFIGPDYEQGLEGLKALAEVLPSADIEGLEVRRVELDPRPIAALSTRAARDPDAMAQALGAAYGQIGLWMQGAGVQIAGAPLAITLADDGSSWVFQAGIPFEGEVPEGAGGPVQVASTAGGKALEVVHRGAYAGLADTRERLEAWMKLHKVEAQGNPWEEYVSDPAVTPEEQPVTKLFVPL